MVCTGYKELYRKNGVTYYLIDLVASVNEDTSNHSTDTNKFQIPNIDGFSFYGTDYSFSVGSKMFEFDTNTSYILDENFEWQVYVEGGATPAPIPEFAFSLNSENGVLHFGDITTIADGIYQARIVDEPVVDNNNVIEILLIKKSTSLSVVRVTRVGKVWSTGINASPYDVPSSSTIKSGDNKYDFYRLKSFEPMIVRLSLEEEE